MHRKKIKADDHANLMGEDQNAKGPYYGSLSQDPIEISELSKPSQATHVTQSTANVFSDGRTRIDFVLVWEADPQEQEGQNEETSAESEVPRWRRAVDVRKTWRKKFLNKLQAAGICIEKHVVQDEKKVVHYVLLNAPWSVLCYYAEDLRLRLPLQALPNQASNWSDRVAKRLAVPSLLHEEVPNLPLDYYTCHFKVNKLAWFLGSNEQDTFFSSTQRHRILYEILATTPYGHLKQGEVGVDRLLSENVFAAAFPLHEGPFALPADRLAPESLTERQVLFQYWARWRKWNRYQPLDHIRRYFGEKIALYFAWLGFYTGWLLPAAVVGTLVFIAGIFLMLSDIPAQEICESEDQYQMCPLCKECPQWQLSSICSMFKAGRLFDHGGTIFFSIFMSLWAVTFLEYWKRMNATLAHRWDCSDFEDIEERPRPQFTAMAPMTMENPITGAEEPYFPKQNRVKRVIAGLMIIIMMRCTRLRRSTKMLSPSKCLSSSLSISTLLPSTLHSSREVLQFGFITIFVAACPLAPLFALLNNWVEIRLDAQKFVCEYRRPVAERAQGIGIWFYILEVITHLAVISNAFLIAFTSDFLPRLYYQYTRASDLQGYVNFTLAYAPKHFASQHNVTCRYRAYRDESGRYSLTYWNLLAIRLGFIIVFEHVVFFIARLIDLMVPDIPESLQIKVKRERYLAKQALAENKVLFERKEVRATSSTMQTAPKDWERGGTHENQEPTPLQTTTSTHTLAASPEAHPQHQFEPEAESP
ncbi:anoctamin-7 isoform X2 [Trachemys scripta elegans]|uniref:anoctamin-7 isoform X2 n=1 Tax=Trachemys scripta elegans TaxID=31138 RepID=UPI001556B18A|nr:anoctamin-7 isoform X2 [Trachemys scripta elegans]